MPDPVKGTWIAEADARKGGAAPHAATLHLAMKPTAHVSVHRRIDDPGYWFVSCYALDMKERLDSLTLDDAKVEALEAVHERVDAFVVALGKIKGDG